MATSEHSNPPGGVHHSAMSGFTAGADAYEKGRPGYPAAVFDWLHDVSGIGPGRAVLEVGAGTGTFTSRLTGTGARVYALEPVAAMRARLVRRAPDALVVAGTADALPLRDGSVQTIVCAQSFHWFATRETLGEFHRVLAQGGVVALVWNVRDESVPWVRRLSAISDAYKADTPRYESQEWRHAFAGSGFVEVSRHEAGHSHEGPVDRVVVTRTMSISFVAALPPDERRALEARLRRFIAEEEALTGKGSVSFPYRTAMHAYRRQ